MAAAVRALALLPPVLLAAGDSGLPQNCAPAGAADLPLCFVSYTMVNKMSHNCAATDLHDKYASCNPELSPRKYIRHGIMYNCYQFATQAKTMRIDGPL